MHIHVSSIICHVQVKVKEIRTCMCVYVYIHTYRFMWHVYAQDKVKEMRKLYPNMAEEEARKIVASRAVADKLRTLQAAAAVAVLHAQSGDCEKRGRERGREGESGREGERDGKGGRGGGGFGSD